MPETLTQNAQCGAKSKSGAPCRRPAGAGTDHVGYGPCKLHGGSTATHRKHAAKLQAAAEANRLGVVMGLPIEVDPLEALLRCIWIAAGEVSYCSDRISELGDDEAVVNYHESQTGSEISYEKTSTAAELNIWIVARRDAMDRLAKYSKMAIDAGVAERQVRVAEKLGGIIGALVQSVLGDLDLSAKQLDAAPGIVRKHLARIANESATA